MVVRCLIDFRLRNIGADFIVEDEFISGKLYVLDEKENLRGEHGNKVPIIGVRHKFKMQKYNYF